MAIHDYMLFIIRTACREFEERLGQLNSPRGEKTGLVLYAIDRKQGAFRIAELQNQGPNVSVDMTRRILKNLQKEGRLECLGRGQNAQWGKTKSWKSGNTPKWVMNLVS
jgi:hypothetical protein